MGNLDIGCERLWSVLGRCGRGPERVERRGWFRDVSETCG